MIKLGFEHCKKKEKRKEKKDYIYIFGILELLRIGYINHLNDQVFQL